MSQNYISALPKHKPKPKQELRTPLWKKYHMDSEKEDYLQQWLTEAPLGIYARHFSNVFISDLFLLSKGKASKKELIKMLDAFYNMKFTAYHISNKNENALTLYFKQEQAEITYSDNYKQYIFLSYGKHDTYKE